MSLSATNRKVDHSALRTNQVFIIGLCILAFVTNIPWIATFVALVMLVGTVLPKVALFKAVYFNILKPLNVVKPDIKLDNPEPHLFAQGVGGVFLTAATIAFIAHVAIVGWALVWIVIALAALNLFANICVGCMMYYWFNRVGLPGFRYAPIKSSAEQ